MENENQFDITQLNEGAWESMKHLGSKLGRFEKGGSFWGKGERGKKAEEQVRKLLADYANQVIKNMRSRLPQGFPNNKSNEEFVKGAERYLNTYNMVVQKHGNGGLTTPEANELIKALRVILKHDLDYKLSTVYQMMKEGDESKNVITTNNDDSTTIKTLKSNKLPMALAAIGMALGPWNFLKDLDWAKDLIDNGAGTYEDVVKELGKIGNGQGITQFLQTFGKVDLGPNASVANFKAVMAKLGGGDINAGYDAISPALAHPEGIDRLKEVIENNPNATMADIFKQNELEMTSGKGGSWFETIKDAKIGRTIQGNFIKWLPKKIAQLGLTWLGNGVAQGVGLGALGAAALLKGARMYGLKHSRAAVLNKILSELNFVEEKQVQANPEVQNTEPEKQTAQQTNNPAITNPNGDDDGDGIPNSMDSEDFDTDNETELKSRVDRINGGGSNNAQTQGQQDSAKNTAVNGIQSNGTNNTINAQGANFVGDNNSGTIVGSNNTGTVIGANNSGTINLNQNIIIVGKKMKELNQLVDAGIITKEKADEVRANAKQAAGKVKKAQAAKGTPQEQALSKEAEEALEFLDDNIDTAKEEAGVETSGQPQVQPTATAAEPTAAEPNNPPLEITNPENVEGGVETSGQPQVQPTATAAEPNNPPLEITNPENVEGGEEDGGTTDGSENPISQIAKSKSHDDFSAEEEAHIEETIGRLIDVENTLSTLPLTEDDKKKIADIQAKVSSLVDNTAFQEYWDALVEAEIELEELIEAVKSRGEGEEVEEVDPNADGALSQELTPEQEASVAKLTKKNASLPTDVISTLVKYQTSVKNILNDAAFSKVGGIKGQSKNLLKVVRQILAGDENYSMTDFANQLEIYKQFFANKKGGAYTLSTRASMATELAKHGININQYLPSKVLSLMGIHTGGTSTKVNNKPYAEDARNIIGLAKKIASSGEDGLSDEENQLKANFPEKLEKALDDIKNGVEPKVRGTSGGNKEIKIEEFIPFPWTKSLKIKKNVTSLNPDGKKRLYPSYRQVLAGRIAKKNAEGRDDYTEDEKAFMLTYPNEYEPNLPTSEQFTLNLSEDEAADVGYFIKQLDNMIKNAPLTDEQKKETLKNKKIAIQVLRGELPISTLIEKGIYTGVRAGVGKKTKAPAKPRTPKQNVVSTSGNPTSPEQTVVPTSGNAVVKPKAPKQVVTTPSTADNPLSPNDPRVKDFIGNLINNDNLETLGKIIENINKLKKISTRKNGELYFNDESIAAINAEFEKIKALHAELEVTNGEDDTLDVNSGGNPDITIEALMNLDGNKNGRKEVIKKLGQRLENALSREGSSIEDIDAEYKNGLNIIDSLSLDGGKLKNAFLKRKDTAIKEYTEVYNEILKAKKKGLTSVEAISNTPSEPKISMNKKRKEAIAKVEAATDLDMLKLASDELMSLATKTKIGRERYEKIIKQKEAELAANLSVDPTDGKSEIKPVDPVKKPVQPELDFNGGGGVDPTITPKPEVVNNDADWAYPEGASDAVKAAIDKVRTLTDKKDMIRLLSTLPSQEEKKLFQPFTGKRAAEVAAEVAAQEKAAQEKAEKVTDGKESDSNTNTSLPKKSNKESPDKIEKIPEEINYNPETDLENESKEYRNSLPSDLRGKLKELYLLRRYMSDNDSTHIKYNIDNKFGDIVTKLLSKKEVDVQELESLKSMVNNMPDIFANSIKLEGLAGSYFKSKMKTVLESGDTVVRNDMSKIPAYSIELNESENNIANTLNDLLNEPLNKLNEVIDRIIKELPENGFGYNQTSVLVPAISEVVDIYSKAWLTHLRDNEAPVLGGYITDMAKAAKKQRLFKFKKISDGYNKKTNNNVKAA
jgi:hypothetical protein